MECRVGILGAGSWGSALTIAFSHAMQVTLWGRDKVQIKNIIDTRSNPGYIPQGIKFSKNVKITSDIDLAIKGMDLVVIATPLSGLREMFLQIRANCADKLPDIIWVCKGLEVGSHLFPHQIALEVLGKFENIGA